MSDVLLEIGCEELPPSCVASGEVQIREGAERLFVEARLPFERIETFATPRRLAVLVRGVPDSQDPVTDERRGPPVSRAFAPDGTPTKAAEGFARSNGVEPGDLVRRPGDGGEYVYAVISRPGTATAEVLPGLLGELVASMSFPKTMRWTSAGVRFPRPVRWLVALYGTDVVPVEFGDVRAGRTSRGHRIFHPGELDIASASAYDEAMRSASVLARRDERREAVRAGAEGAAGEMGGRPVLHEHVLDEVTDLVELPQGLAGSFDEAYLQIPAPVLQTAMESHQRYFPVIDPDGRLRAGFVLTSNGDPSNAGVVRAGNERVLRARLEDARFFWQEDLRIGLSGFAAKLGDLVFHARLGTMRDKAQRVRSLVEHMAQRLGVSPDEAEAAARAAEVYRADLLTSVVYEFPELQGIMGREYALRDERLASEAGDVLPALAGAIGEQYLPRFAGDDLPGTTPGAILGLADRLDTLVGYIGIGQAPSGSEDPFALRRTANGFVAVALAHDARVPLDDAIGMAYSGYAAAGVDMEAPAAVGAQVRNVLVARAEAVLEREGIDRMLVRSASAGTFQDLPDLAERARALGTFHASGRLHQLAVAHERAFNLSRNGPHPDVDAAALQHPAEQSLLERLAAVEDTVAAHVRTRDYRAALEGLASLADVVDVFFDRERGVLVMDPDERIRANRLSLLDRTARVFGLVADFSGVIPAELEGEPAAVGARAADATS